MNNRETQRERDLLTCKQNICRTPQFKRKGGFKHWQVSELYLFNWFAQMIHCPNEAANWFLRHVSRDKSQLKKQTWVWSREPVQRKVFNACAKYLAHARVSLMCELLTASSIFVAPLLQRWDFYAQAPPFLLLWKRGKPISGLAVSC